ncbi:MAG: L-seryl-tRNA(Sec) selenium transferase [Frankiales bacterium]|nr:L-seryl-tRNA(Sec) selenium transferase [Frankiales bacterium]
MTDVRRSVPRTDDVLSDPRLLEAVGRLGRAAVKQAVRAAQDEVRAARLPPGDVVSHVLSALPVSAPTLRPVLNATGVVLHTNLGRAPLSQAAVEAMALASGYVDVELDLGTGRRTGRGRGALAALRDAVPEAEQVLVVNNGAAALVLATTALAAGREVVVSRGELVEIGDGFRLPDLVRSTGAQLHEVGTTNRTVLTDYAAAVGARTGCLLKVHPSNFTVSGFTGSVAVAELTSLGVPVVVDVGSGLLRPNPLLPSEPDVASALTAGAGVVTCSGDKLLGGPQAGLVLGRAELLDRLRRHPLYRAFRCDKTTLAALEATLRGPETPVHQALHAETKARTVALAKAVGGSVVEVQGAVGGGGAPGVGLPGWAVALPPYVAERLRQGDPPVLARVADGRALVDLRCVPAADDEVLRAAVLACLR